MWFLHDFIWLITREVFCILCTAQHSDCWGVKDERHLWNFRCPYTNHRKQKLFEAYTRKTFFFYRGYRCRNWLRLNFCIQENVNEQNRLYEAVIVHFCMREAFSSDLGWRTRYPSWDFRGVSRELYEVMNVLSNYNSKSIYCFLFRIFFLGIPLLQLV
jgi:hypothetical protein